MGQSDECWNRQGMTLGSFAIQFGSDRAPEMLQRILVEERCDDSPSSYSRELKKNALDVIGILEVMEKAKAHHRLETPVREGETKCVEADQADGGGGCAKTSPRLLEHGGGSIATDDLGGPRNKIRKETTCSTRHIEDRALLSVFQNEAPENFSFSLPPALKTVFCEVMSGFWVQIGVQRVFHGARAFLWGARGMLRSAKVVVLCLDPG